MSKGAGLARGVFSSAAGWLLSPAGMDPLTFPCSPEKSLMAPGPHLWGRPKPAPSPQRWEERRDAQVSCWVLPPLIPITRRNTGVMSCARHQPPNQLLGQPPSSATNILPKRRAGCDAWAEKGCSVPEPPPPGYHRCNFPGLVTSLGSFPPTANVSSVIACPRAKNLHPFHPARTHYRLWPVVD